jgi:arylsulfatase A-like enzyme
MALAVGLAGGCGGPPPAYNVLLISLDTVRRDALGCYGASPVHAPGISPTPALDDLARQGVRMLDAYAPSSWTLPSHLSLMTGEPPLVHGVETEVGTLDPSSPTLAEILRQHGYRRSGYTRRRTSSRTGASVAASIATTRRMRRTS